MAKEFSTRTDVLKAVQDMIWEKVRDKNTTRYTEARKIPETAFLDEFGIEDSLDKVEFVMDLERNFSVNIPDGNEKDEKIVHNPMVKVSDVVQFMCGKLGIYGYSAPENPVVSTSSSQAVETKPKIPEGTAFKPIIIVPDYVNSTVSFRIGEQVLSLNDPRIVMALKKLDVIVAEISKDTSLRR